MSGALRALSFKGLHWFLAFILKVWLTEISVWFSTMVECGSEELAMNSESAETWLLRAQELVFAALTKAREVRCFPGRWKMIVLKLEQIPSRLSDLSSHPFFSKNPLCKEQLQAVVSTANDVISSSERCVGEKYEGKLRMQSDLDALIGRLDLNLRDCGLLIKTGVLGEATIAEASSSSDSDSSASCNIRELLARLQIGHFESKRKALDRLVEVLYEDEKAVLGVLGRSNIAALVQLLTASSPRTREKAAVIVSSVVESGSGTFENWLVSEGVVPQLIRLLESGSGVGREKALISLQKLSATADTARAIVERSGVRPLVEVSGTNDSVAQIASAGTLRNLSAVPEARRELAEEGAVRAMIDLLDFGILPGAKEYAAECLRNLTLDDESLKSLVISEGGFVSLLAYVGTPSPQEPAVSALGSLVHLIPTEVLVLHGFLSRAAHALRSGSLGAKQAAASAICRASTSPEMKKMVGEAGCFPLLVNLLEAKPHRAREAAAQAISVLITLPHNGREFKKVAKCVPNLVHLLDPAPQNSAKKYAVASLVILSSGRECRRQMIANGGIGYLKKLTETDVPGSKKLLEALERGGFRSLFRSHSMRL